MGDGRRGRLDRRGGSQRAGINKKPHPSLSPAQRAADLFTAQPPKAVYAQAILIADMKSRRRHYETLGMEMDETVDWERVEAYYEELEDGKTGN